MTSSVFERLTLIPFAVQGVAMMADEFHFHRQRDLPSWERVGHALDTISVLSYYLFLLFSAPGDVTKVTYVGLATFSCVLITKDEFVHRKLCSAFEMWLHAVLFVLHPVALGFGYWLWVNRTASDRELYLFNSAIGAQTVIIFCFLLYQVFYWNFMRAPFDEGKYDSQQ